MKKWLLIGALALALAPATASADWLFTPNLGAGFGGSASGREHMTWGASIGWMGEGIFGWEADLAYTPEFFESDDDDLDAFDSSNATSFMANVLLGVPIGGQLGPGFRPYVSGGAGLLQKVLKNYLLLQQRVNLGEIETSKLLRKPLNVQTGKEDGHQGGRRYVPAERGYQIIRRWVLDQPRVVQSLK
jgi:hypothetical protein